MVLLALIFIFLRIFFPAASVAIATPLWQAGSSFNSGIGNFFSGFGNSTKLAQENAAFVSEVATLQNENEVLTARAQDLTKLLGGQSGSTQGSTIPAGVLARPPESPYDSLVVAAGSADGIATGAEVFSSGGIPIGTVASVTAHSATIQLLSTPGVTTNGWVGENRIPLTLSGMGAGAFTAILPKAATITVGDNVYVSGPGAIPLGTIVRIDDDPSSPTAELYIQPLVNIFSLTWVEVSISSR